MLVLSATFPTGALVWYYSARKFVDRTPEWKKTNTGPI